MQDPDLKAAIRRHVSQQASRAARVRWKKFRADARAAGVDPDLALSIEMSRRRNGGKKPTKQDNRTMFPNDGMAF